jgi:hypothetical protein
MPRLVIAISLARFCGYCFSGRIDIIAKPLPVIRRGEEIVLFCDRQPSKPVVRRIARLPVANASAGNFNRNEPGGNYFAEGMADQPPADPGFSWVSQHQARPCGGALSLSCTLRGRNPARSCFRFPISSPPAHRLGIGDLPRTDVVANLDGRLGRRYGVFPRSGREVPELFFEVYGGPRGFIGLTAMHGVLL